MLVYSAEAVAGQPFKLKQIYRYICFCDFSKHVKHITAYDFIHCRPHTLAVSTRAS
nr:MAG TPA: hypothetical protein [Caudoviricetes sp.]